MIVGKEESFSADERMNTVQISTYIYYIKVIYIVGGRLESERTGTHDLHTRVFARDRACRR